MYNIVIIIIQLTSGWGKLMSADIVSMFMITLKCRTTTFLGITWRPLMFPWGALAPLPYSFFFSPFGYAISPGPIPMRFAIPYTCSSIQYVSIPNDTFWLSTEYCWTVVPGKHRTHSKHGSSNSISFQ